MEEIQFSDGFLEEERKTHFNKVYGIIFDNSTFYDWGRQALK